MDERFMLELILSNKDGAFHRMIGLFNKRGFTIQSLAMNETENSDYLKVNILSKGGTYTQSQMLKQVQKLYDVVSAELRLVSHGGNN